MRISLIRDIYVAYNRFLNHKNEWNISKYLETCVRFSCRKKKKGSWKHRRVYKRTGNNFRLDHQNLSLGNEVGTWIESAPFKNDFMEIKEIINNFNSSNAISIRDAKETFETPSTPHDLNLIYTIFLKYRN